MKLSDRSCSQFITADEKRASLTNTGVGHAPNTNSAELASAPRRPRPRKAAGEEEREPGGQESDIRGVIDQIQQRESSTGRVTDTHQWAIDSLSRLCRGIIYSPPAPPSRRRHDVIALAEVDGVQKRRAAELAPGDGTRRPEEASLQLILKSRQTLTAEKTRIHPACTRRLRPLTPAMHQRALRFRTMAGGVRAL